MVIVLGIGFWILLVWLFCGSFVDAYYIVLDLMD
jgi:hypothetical protein